MKSKSLVLILSLGLLSMTGCAAQSVLIPAHPKAGAGKAPAVESHSGVSLFAGGESWKGDPAVREKVTVLKVRILNGHERDLCIRYRDFSLLSPSTTRYSALPPHDIKGTVSRIRRVDPLFYHHSFHISPHYSRVYPHLSVYGHSFYNDPLYYDHYYTYWEKIDLPTDEMLEAALPEGALEKGGEVSGFLYFEKIGEETQVDFRMELVDPANGTIFGTITIPFVVQRKFW